MKNIYLLIIPFAIIGFWEVPKLIKKKYWRELIVFLVIFIITFAFSLLLVLGVKIPRPIFIGI